MGMPLAVNDIVKRWPRGSESKHVPYASPLRQAPSCLERRLYRS
jgi:hypothetical protein